MNAAPPQYSQENEAGFRAWLNNILNNTFRRGQDIEVGAGRLILKDTVTGARASITLASGVVTVVNL